MSKQPSATLDQRIASALSDAKISSGELTELITETETAFAAAEVTAQAEREKALDPIASPDTDEAERSLRAAELSRDRLRSSLCRLRLRFDEVAMAEYTAHWEADYEALEARQNALAKEFSEKYQKLTLCDLFRRALAIDEERSRVNGTAPPGESRRLRGVSPNQHSLTS